MKLETGKISHHLFFNKPEKFLVIMENDKVVHIAEIKSATEVFFDKVIETVKINVRKKLAGQIANRNAC